MKYFCLYSSPLGNIILQSDGEALTGLDFENSKVNEISKICNENNLKIFDITKQWLDIYFSGKEPTFVPKLNIQNITPFKKEVINEMLKIPYGKTATYKEIAFRLANKRNILKMSAQAVGGAVGKNPIAIIIPCHRVVGTNGNLTGYAGGLLKKVELLKLEGIDVSKFSMPSKSKFL